MTPKNAQPVPVLDPKRPILPKPRWIRVKAPSGQRFNQTRSIVRQHRLHTICEEAICPNIGECWRNGTATYLLMGDRCTRRCRFCAVEGGAPAPLDQNEPERIAQAAEIMKLRHVVLTSVTRDDLSDGGANHIKQTVSAIKRRLPDCSIETLIPDLSGNWDVLEELLHADIAVLNHNLETVPRLYSDIRPQADYSRSLELLDRARQLNPDRLTKSGLMVGLGEEKGEILDVMADLREAGCSILTVGQYLQPSPAHHPVVRYIEPCEFDDYACEGLKMGFTHVESAPFVRSSYHAWKHAR